MKKISLGGIEVKEYGFSKAVWQLCPEGWKKPLGDDWEDVLSVILRKWSPETCLVKESPAKKCQGGDLKKIFYWYQFLKKG